MNAGGVPDTCKSNGRVRVDVLEAVEYEKSLEAVEGIEALMLVSGGRVSNTWIIYPQVGNNCSKEQLIPHNIPLGKKGLRPA